MQKLLYFLIGLFFSFFLANILYAGTCSNDTTAVHDAIDQMFALDECKEYVGSFDTIDECSTAVGGYNYSAGVPGGTAYIRTNFGSCPSGYLVYAFLPYNCEQVSDLDDDGIIDQYDLYPEDPTPYEFAIISEVTDNSNGQTVHYIIKTDRGDIFYVGERPQDMTGYTDSIYINPMMIAGSQYESLFGPGSYTDPIQVETSDIFNTYNDALVVGDPDSGSATGMTDGTTSTGTETDSQALGTIIDNTAITANNVSRLGDYLSEINKSLAQINTKQTMDLADIVDNSGVDNLTLEETTQAFSDALEPSQGEIDSGLGAAGNVDTEFSEAQTSITGEASLEADAPLEYQEKTDIVTKMQDYISNNPISDIISGTTITASGSPTVNFIWKGHTIPLTIDGFDTELALFGQALLALTTIAGLMLVFRGF